MANIEKLFETMAVIEENQARWRQNAWMQGEIDSEAKDWHTCGATMCFAGWVAVLNGWKPTYELGEVWRLNTADGRGEFVPQTVTGVMMVPRDKDGRAGSDDAIEYGRKPQYLAQEILELTDRETAILFIHSTDITDVVKMRELVTAVAEGKAEEYFTTHDRCGDLYSED